MKECLKQKTHLLNSDILSQRDLGAKMAILQKYANNYLKKLLI